MDLKVARDARMEPPIHVESIRSGGAWILIFVWSGRSDRSSLRRRSPKPGKSVEPPARTICW